MGRDAPAWQFVCTCGARGPLHHQGLGTAPRERERCVALSESDFWQHFAAQPLQDSDTGEDDRG